MTMFCDCGNPEAHRGEHIPKPVTDTPLALDAIEARAVAVAHHRTGPGRCACGYDAYKVGGFFPDYHAMLMNHLARAPRAVTPANTDDVLALVAALRRAEAQVAAVLALCDQADARLGQGNSLTPTAVRAAVDGAS